MKRSNRFGKLVIRIVNRHWLFFGVFTETPIGMMLGFAVGYSGLHKEWIWFTVAVVLSILWMIALFMKGYTDSKNK